MEEDVASLGRAVRTAAQSVRRLELQVIKQRNQEQQDNPSEANADVSKPQNQERDIVLKFCKVVRSVGKTRGDNLLNPTALKRYGRLKQAADSIEKACKESGPEGSKMFRARNPQKDLFSARNQYRDALEDDSFHALLSDFGEELFDDYSFEYLYTENNGRPCIPPSQMFVLLLLQMHDGCSDKEAVERARWDLR